MGGQSWSQLARLCTGETLTLGGKPLSPAARLALMSSAAHVLGYWLPNLFLYVIWRNGWFFACKLQGKTMPSQQLINQELLDNVAGTLFGIPATAYLFYSLMSRSRLTDAIVRLFARITTTNTDDENEQPWCRLRFSGADPPLWHYVTQVLLAYLIYDCMFYWTHRALHEIPGAYQAVHSRHHKFFASVGIAASYAHPVENLANAFSFWLPIAFSGWLHGDLHAKIYLAYAIFRWLETVDAHSGYVLPFSPFALIPLFGGAKQHDAHHAYVDGNYGASRIWDTLMGTRQQQS